MASDLPGDPDATGVRASIVARRYQVFGEIARGGCGSVYEARDLDLDRVVAIKVLHSATSDRSAAARFEREARVAASIQHPNVCAVTDAGIHDDGSPFLVMDRLDGETLRARVTREGALDPEEAIELSVQMLSGLEAAHSLGIVHRDMKPENVFIASSKTRWLRVKLLDFGMCRRKSAGEEALDDGTLTRVGTVVGTPEYMAPEQASGRRDFDLRIDLYAVGVMLYEMLTGKRAFKGTDPRAVLVSVLSSAIPSVRAARPELPLAIDRIVSHAVERDPRARYRDAAEFQHDLLKARTALRRLRSDGGQRRASVVPPFSERSAVEAWEAPTRQLPITHGHR